MQLYTYLNTKDFCFSNRTINILMTDFTGVETIETARQMNLLNIEVFIENKQVQFASQSSWMLLFDTLRTHNKCLQFYYQPCTSWYKIMLTIFSMQKCNIKKLKLFQGYLSFDVAHSHHMTKYPFEDTEKQHGARKISAKKTAHWKHKRWFA